MKTSGAALNTIEMCELVDAPKTQASAPVGYLPVLPDLPCENVQISRGLRRTFRSRHRNRCSRSGNCVFLGVVNLTFRFQHVSCACLVNLGGFNGDSVGYLSAVTN